LWNESFFSAPQLKRDPLGSRSGHPMTHRRLKVSALAIAWLALMAAAYWARRRSSFDPLSRAFGHNWPGDLQNVALYGGLEILILTIIVRPWSYDRSWGRALIATGLLIPYTAFALVATMHAGTIIFIHALWLVALLVAMLMLTLVSLIRSPIRAAA